MVRPAWMLLTLLVAATACDDSSTSANAPTSPSVSPPASPGSALLLSRRHARTPVVLTGAVIYWTYAPRIRTLLQDAPFVVPTSGTTTTLEFLGGDSVRLQLHEDHIAAGEGDRWTTLEGTLEHNGKLTLDYVGLSGGPMPEWAPGVPFLVGMVQWHSGCNITSGDFPRQHGRFDGEKLVTAATFRSVCPGPSGTPEAPIFATPVLGRDGALTPVDWAWKIDLRVVKDHEDRRDNDHHGDDHR